MSKVVIVTGAFGVLGHAVAAAFLANGDRVATVDLATEPPPGVAAQLNGALMVEGCDLTAPEQASAAVKSVLDRFGRIDAVVNIAGGFVWETLADGSAETWDRLYAMNVRTCANMCRAALPALIEARGSIVNVGAAGALKAAAGMGAYAASKSGVHRLTEALAEEQKGKVRVNAVLPSILDTPRNRADMPKADPAAWVAPVELTAVILFLTSDAASAVTGALIPVTGRV
ncbi:MAG TPA: SDR family NAD(P)-dependent oxidoreductase [Caulobacteraceae bacterium]|nr:SDR family NAD(P)-dependent oxidoreductase [Caulobacteraceae bacterium]